MAKRSVSKGDDIVSVTILADGGAKLESTEVVTVAAPILPAPVVTVLLAIFAEGVAPADTIAEQSNA